MPIAHNIYYACSPAIDTRRPPLVLIHGAGGDSRSWPVEVRRLGGWQVMALDLPGHGRSSGLPRQSVRALCRDLLAFLNEMQIFRVVLAGHSLGAAIALQLAAEFPERMAGLCLISACAHLHTPPLLVDYFTNPLTIPLGLALFRQWAFSPGTPPTQVEAVLTGLRAVRPAVLAGDWRSHADFDFQGSLAGVNAPALIVSGGDDRLAPPQCAHYLSAQLKHATLRMVPAAGHMLPVEQPAALTAVLKAFLQTLAAPAAD